MIGERLRGVFPVSTGLVVSRSRGRSGWSRSMRSRCSGRDDVLARSALRPAAGAFGASCLVLQPGGRRALRPRARRRRRRRVAERDRPVARRRAARPARERAAGARGDRRSASRRRPTPSYRQLTVRRRRRARRRVLGRAHARAARDGRGAAVASRRGTCSPTRACPSAMVEAFEASAGDDLGDRLVAALSRRARGRAARRGRCAPPGCSWSTRDLAGRRPARRLARRAGRTSFARLWPLWQPQLDAYVHRALDPSQAPSYGVPGDE